MSDHVGWWDWSRWWCKSRCGWVSIILAGSIPWPTKTPAPIRRMSEDSDTRPCLCQSNITAALPLKTQQTTGVKIPWRGIGYWQEWRSRSETAPHRYFGIIWEATHDYQGNQCSWGWRSSLVSIWSLRSYGNTTAAIAIGDSWRSNGNHSPAIAAIECIPQYTVIGRLYPRGRSSCTRLLYAPNSSSERYFWTKSTSAPFPLCPLPAPSYECENEKITTFEHNPFVQSRHILTWRQNVRADRGCRNHSEVQSLPCPQRIDISEDTRGFITDSNIVLSSFIIRSK